MNRMYRSKKHHSSSHSKRSSGKSSSVIEPVPEPTPAEKAKRIQDDLEEVKRNMWENIDRTKARGERITAMEEATHDLEVSAQAFQKDAGKVKAHLWWKNKRYTIMLATVAAVIISLAISKSPG